MLSECYGKYRIERENIHPSSLIGVRPKKPEKGKYFEPVFILLEE